MAKNQYTGACSKYRREGKTPAEVAEITGWRLKSIEGTYAWFDEQDAIALQAAPKEPQAPSPVHPEPTSPPSPMAEPLHGGPQAERSESRAILARSRGKGEPQAYEPYPAGPHRGPGLLRRLRRSL